MNPGWSPSPDCRMLSLEAAATMAREMGWLVERSAIRGWTLKSTRRVALNVEGREGTLTVDQTGAAKQGANHARRQTVLRTAVDCQRSPSSWSLCPGGRRDSPLPRSLNTKSKDSRVYGNAQISSRKLAHPSKYEKF
ncbi:Uncharacterized protein DBV15_10362 [Temnothorax longispinosus]|uniref:Uncharacterized protein n=1 Tax=Temnothorax longispinosus TaxID=300112 RepID=A0A4S2KSK7_9HYME|nr:Uncharacterized protein DBV15_10362 [Temnothorax longispinosus]